MNARIGTYLTQKTPGESFKAYIPPRLPPVPPIDMGPLSFLLEKATLALAKLNSTTQTIPNTSLLLYAYVRKEALLSSQIEGTQSSFSDLMLFEHDQATEVSIEDVEEVSNYVKAMYHGLKRLEEGFPVSLRLIKEIHAILLSGGRGKHKQPGEFRRTQNWIGGTRPGNALFVPPPVDALADALSNLEAFLHDDTFPVLIKTGLAHLQFESIHPFLDGNGRLGRLIITLLLCNGGMLDAPILYLSLFLKQNHRTYYRLLQEVREQGTWEAWLEFFLEGVITSSNQGILSAQAMETLFATDQKKIMTLGRARASARQTLDFLKQLPQVSAPLLAKELKVSTPTARSALQNLLDLGIIREKTGKARDKIYVYQSYLDILEEGAEPF